MSLIGLRFDATTEFQSEADTAKGTDDATVFILGTLTARMQVHLRDQATKFKPDPDNPDNIITEFLPNQSAFDTARFALKGWKNFKDEDGKDVPFATEKKSLGSREFDVVTEECLDCLHADVIREIAEELNKVNALSEEESKNSGG